MSTLKSCVSEDTQSQHWQLLEPDYINKRFEQEIARHECAVIEQEAQADAPNSLASAKAMQEALNLHYWQGRLNQLKSHDSRVTEDYRGEYRYLVKKGKTEMTTGEYTESRKNKRMTRATVELNAARTYVRQSRPADRDAGILPRHMAGLPAIFGPSEAE